MSNLEEDYLDEDKPVKGQNFVCLSFLTHLSFPENRRDEFKDQKVLGVKVRGVYKSFEEADARAKQLQKIDKRHHVFVGEVGKWLPFDQDTSNVDPTQQVYREQQLNQYMKTYFEAQKDEDDMEAARKAEMLKDAKVVTGKHDAPESTGLGEGYLADRKKPTAEQIQLRKKGEDPEMDAALEKIMKEEKELGENRAQAVQLNIDLQNSQVTLGELETKMAAINDIYKKLNEPD